MSEPASVREINYWRKQAGQDPLPTEEDLDRLSGRTPEKPREEEKW